MTSELKPCPNPWCAENNVRHISWELYSRRVFCTCGVSGPPSPSKSLDGGNVDALDAEAIAAWNTRAAAPAPAVDPMSDPRVVRLVEALEQIKRGDFSIMTPPSYVTNPKPSAQEIARAALAALDTPQ